MKTLIVNMGPPGDIVRTTVLFNALEGELFFLSSLRCKDLLNSKKLSKVFFLEEGTLELEKIEFDLIISMNEDLPILKLINKLKTKKIIGIYLKNNDEIEYTPESAEWNNMSLISKFGKEKANELKLANKKPLQEMMIEMVGGKWKGQEYDLGIDIDKTKEIKGKIGLINVATGLWKSKLWAYYEELYNKLKEEGREVVFLEMRPSIKEHIEDITTCELVVCGDTLGMHLAIALKKKVIVLFICTSPTEIYDYGKVTKIISPKYHEYFYKKEYIKEATESISINSVLEAIKNLQKLN